MSRGKGRGAVWFLALLGVSVLLQLLPLLYDGSTEVGALMYVLHPWVLTLPLCFAGPFLAARRVTPLAAFFPPGLAFLLSPLYPGHAAAGLAMLLMSLLSAEAGSLYAQRRERANGKGAGHGSNGRGHAR